jgi:hypothetical protein
MSNQAKVTSLDALDSLRASLIIFLGKARRSLDDAGDELRRMRLWLQHDMRTRWENEARKCRRALEAAEQELFSAKLSGLRENLNLQQTAVRKAKQALEHAEGKLRNVRTWSRNYEAAADPLAKRLEGLRQFLDLDLPKGIAYIVQMQRTLGDYAEMSPPPEIAPSASGVEDENENEKANDKGKDNEPSTQTP